MRLLRRLWAMLRVRRLEEDLSDELQFHREMKEQELAARPPFGDAGALAARAALGNATRSREDARAIWLWPWLESAWQDGVYATVACGGSRASRWPPCALGVSIGLNSSLFTVFAGLALRPMAGRRSRQRRVGLGRERLGEGRRDWIAS